MRQAHMMEMHYNNPNQHVIAWEVLELDLDGSLFIDG